MNGGTKTTTQATTNEPWDAAQPVLKAGIDKAQDLYNTGQAWGPYTGSTVVPYSDRTVAGQEAIQGRALDNLGGNSPFDMGWNFLGDTLGGTGLSDYQSQIGDMWSGIASGNELNGQSPEFENVLNRALEDASTGTNLAMAGAGRFASPVHTSTLAKELGGISSNARLGDYYRQLGRRDDAMLNLANLGQQGMTNRFGAQSALPGAWEAGRAPASDLMTVGAMDEDLMGRALSDQLRIWEGTKNAPKDALEWLMAIGSGAGSLGSQSNTTAQTPTPNPFVSALVGGAGLLNAFNPFGGVPGVSSSVPFY